MLIDSTFVLYSIDGVATLPYNGNVSLHYYPAHVFRSVWWRLSYWRHALRGLHGKRSLDDEEERYRRSRSYNERT